MSKRALGICAGLMLLLGSSHTVDAFAQQQPAERERFHIYLLAGQSNMAGRGVVAAEDSVVHPRVWMLTEDLEWAPAVDPMHFDKPIAGVGPGRSFGIAMADADPTVHIGLVPAAVGGSAIGAWVPGGIHAETGAYPYDEAVVRVMAALEGGVLKGILWHQGESDSNARSASDYEGNLRRLIERFRDRFDQPNLPFAIGQLGRFDGSEWDAAKSQVDAAHRAIAASVPDVTFVSAEGLMDKGDGIHFDAAAARELGRRYAAAYRGLVERSASVPLGSPQR